MEAGFKINFSLFKGLNKKVFPKNFLSLSSPSQCLSSDISSGQSILPLHLKDFDKQVPSSHCHLSCKQAIFLQTKQKKNVFQFRKRA